MGVEGNLACFQMLAQLMGFHSAGIRLKKSLRTISAVAAISSSAVSWL